MMKRQFEQLYYTSAMHGELGGSGFQVWAKSQGITQLNRDEIISNVTYARPNRLPDYPGDEELERDFPKALRWGRLPGGEYILSLTCYTGAELIKGDSPRAGNFFAHALMTDGPWEGAWPIDCFEWPGWKTILTKEEDEDRYETPLPPAEMDAELHSESFDFPELAQFLGEVDRGREIITSMLRCVMSVKQAGDEAPVQQLLIRDSHINNFYWIACIQKAFPKTCATDLSFSTYSYNYNSIKADVIATTENSQFGIPGVEFDRQFLGFDLVGSVVGQAATLTSETSDLYADTLSEWLVSSPDKIASFQEFLEHFQLREIDENLVYALQLFLLINGESVALGDEEVVSILAFFGRYCVPEMHENLFALFSERVVNMFNGVASEQVLILFEGLSAAAMEGDSPVLRNHVYDAWKRALVAQLSGRGSLSWKDLFTVFDTVWNRMQGHVREFAEVVLGKDVEQLLLDKLSSFQAEDQLELLVRYIRCLKRVHGQGGGWTPAIASLIGDMLQTGGMKGTIVEPLMADSCDTVETTEAVIKCIAESILKATQDGAVEQYNQIVGSALNNVLKSKPGTLSADIRTRLDVESYYSLVAVELTCVLQDDFAARIEEGEEPLGVARGYYPDYFEQNKSSVLLLCLNLLDAASVERVLNYVLQVFKSGEIGELDKGAQITFIAKLNSLIAIHHDHEEMKTITASALRINKELGGLADGERLAACRAVSASCHKGFVDAANRKVLDEYAGSLDDKDFELLMHAVFSHCMNVSRGYGYHSELMPLLFRESCQKVLVKEYDKWVESLGCGDPDSLSIPVAYWIGDGLESYGFKVEYRQKALVDMVDIAARVEKKRLPELYSASRKLCEKYATDDEWKELFTEFQKHVKHRNSSWLGRVEGFARKSVKSLFGRR